MFGVVQHHSVDHTLVSIHAGKDLDCSWYAKYDKNTTEIYPPIDSLYFDKGKLPDEIFDEWKKVREMF